MGQEYHKKRRKKSSVIEDVWFKELDSECSKIVKVFRDGENLESLHSTGNIAEMQYFIINQLWRLPKFDFAFDYLFNNASIINGDGREIVFKNLEEEEFVKSFERINLPSKIIGEIKRHVSTERVMSKLFGRGKGEFILGDYPMLFKKQPISIDEILYQEVFLPISSDRLYSLSSNGDFNFNFEDSIKINTLILNQSRRYVCSHNREFLQKSVSFYKKIGKIISVESLKNDIFK